MRVLKHKLLSFTALSIFGLSLLSVGPSLVYADSTNSLDQVGVERSEEDCKVDSGQQLNEDNCGIIKIVVTITNALSAIAAVVIIAVIVWGGVQYSAAGADSSKVQAAKSKITNALLALLLLIFGYSLLQWLVPGGVISGFGFYY